MESKASAAKQRLVAMVVSVSVSTLLMGVKFYTYWLTGSAAILSDALESIINVVASGFALYSVMFAAKPPDLSHPYGHGKAEYFSAGFEGALIILAAGAIVWEALPRILQPQPVPRLDAGLLLLLGTCAVNGALGIWLVRKGLATNSAAVSADGKHIISDVYTSAGVIAGLVLVRQTGWLQLDGAIACLVALNILVIGVRLVRESSSRLMDASDPELLDQITAVISKNRRPQWIDVHRMRAWRSGERIHADFHLILPRSLSLEAAHKEVTEVERILQSQVPGMGDALVHAEPCIMPEFPICGYAPCAGRKEPALRQPLWYRDAVVSPAGDPGGKVAGGLKKQKSGRRFSRVDE
ncbi:MAG: cation diffusion facilitator family transporter [Desulfobacteraceae bacterium]|nr:cation diffusion facilitator family transporter [Desulfobacteraceae bacterium]